MNIYYTLEPEVAGELGSETILDSTKHPPKVDSLHYEFFGWLGDEILEAYPCFIASERCRNELERASLSGIEWGPVKITKSLQFEELYPGRGLPSFFWMKVTGLAEKDDFGMNEDSILVISARALKVLRNVALNHADVEGIS